MEPKLIGFKIMARNKAKLTWLMAENAGPSDVWFQRIAISRCSEMLAKISMLDPRNMPEGTEVIIDPDTGKVTSRQAYGIVRPGRRPKGDKPLTGAERQRAYMKSLREKAGLE